MVGKVAVVGCGAWGRNLVRSFSSLLGPENVVCSDAHGPTLAQVVRDFPGVSAAPDLKGVLEDPQVHAVAIATPVVTHYAVASQVLDSGKHAFVEKPLAMRRSEALALCSLAERRGLCLMVDHVVLFDPGTSELVSRVRAGEVGDLYYVAARRTNLGVVRSEENVLWSLAPHDFAIFLTLFDSDPERVSATGWAFLKPKYRTGSMVEDLVFVTLDFGRGRVAYLHTSWLDPRKSRSLTVAGSRRMMLLEDKETPIRGAPTVSELRVFDAGTEFSEAGARPRFIVPEGTVIETPAHEPLWLACEHFLLGTGGRAVETSSGRFGARVVAALEAAQKSLDREGKWVRLKDVR